MKYNIKKEIDQESKYFKGLLNQTYRSFLTPLASEVTSILKSMLQADTAIMFMLNAEIDHLYSLSLGADSN
jgi:hypothetical protein